jgi:alanine racemase
MNRLGFTPDAYRLAYHRLHAQGHHVHHMTHFANADRVDREPSVGAQMECFSKTIDGLQGETSLANSAAVLWHRNALGDWVRPGIMLHGISPTGAYKDIEHAHLKTVMSLSSKIIAVQELQAGYAVGYGARYVAKQAMRIGVIACGYADGYPRHAVDGTPVWVSGPTDKTSGIICPIAGQVSMDMLTIDLSHAPWATLGTSVELWGKNLPVDDVANQAQTIGYELVCAIAPRVPVEII